MSTPFRNVLSEALSDYIAMEDLEVRLRFLFQQPIQVRSQSGRYVFDAPREVKLEEIA
ncbi:hypothetical protein ASPVEDRAFT_77877 [Aspergillus versicolor CBS 583.65]|uniref:Uncharacterized protein n=1 Tax=Aspergillus versicolor CBS 583.65 TaxID=1036611 RepID=A0A1L9P3K5_ASPVE|nr:uncharacterized protein ASPVEDRAFT_77877 [Aspergillus versicolor CBS 583.65]OJI96101.1 hypothetical protein ASPVEDRAFT_77877 [Aspergillus versicolor CBS 583.65]